MLLILLQNLFRNGNEEVAIAVLSAMIRQVHDYIVVNRMHCLGGESLNSSLEGAVVRVFQKDLYDRADFNDGLDGVCFLTEALIHAHAFNDGNKRTAALTLLMISAPLDEARWKIRSSHGLENLIIEIATKEKNWWDLRMFMEAL